MTQLPAGLFLYLLVLLPGLLSWAAELPGAVFLKHLQELVKTDTDEHGEYSHSDPARLAYHLVFQNHKGRFILARNLGQLPPRRYSDLLLFKMGDRGDLTDRTPRAVIAFQKAVLPYWMGSDTGEFLLVAGLAANQPSPKKIVFDGEGAFDSVDGAVETEWVRDSRGRWNASPLWVFLTSVHHNATLTDVRWKTHYVPLSASWSDVLVAESSDGQIAILAYRVHRSALEGEILTFGRVRETRELRFSKSIPLSLRFSGMPIRHLQDFFFYKGDLYLLAANTTSAADNVEMSWPFLMRLSPGASEVDRYFGESGIVRLPFESHGHQQEACFSTTLRRGSYGPSFQGNYVWGPKDLICDNNLTVQADYTAQGLLANCHIARGTLPDLIPLHSVKKLRRGESNLWRLFQDCWNVAIRRKARDTIRTVGWQENYSEIPCSLTLAALLPPRPSSIVAELEEH